MIARLSRIVPLLIVLAVVAAIVYIVAAWRYSPNAPRSCSSRCSRPSRACCRCFFLLACAYAWLEHNDAVFDLAFSFLLTTLIGLAVTRICRRVFLRHNPAYRIKAAKTTRPGSLFDRWRKR